MLIKLQNDELVTFRLTVDQYGEKLWASKCKTSRPRSQFFTIRTCQKANNTLKTVGRKRKTSPLILPGQFYGHLAIGCVSLRKSRIGFLNPKGSESRFCVSLLNRSVQDLPDHGESKERKNPLPKWILWFIQFRFLS